MALLHRDRTDTATTDTVSGSVPAWPSTTTATPAPVAATEPEERVVRRNSFGQTLRTILATVLLVAIVAVAVANSDEVGIDLLFEQVDAPLSALVGAAAGAGFLVGLLLGRRRRTT